MTSFDEQDSMLHVAARQADHLRKTLERHQQELSELTPYAAEDQAATVEAIEALDAVRQALKAAAGAKEGDA
jgi:hypothetical protein